MGPETLGALSALFFASNQVFTRRALESTTLQGVVFLTIGTATIVLGTAALIVGSAPLSPREILVFSAAGLSGSGVGTWASIKGIERLGATVAVPIHQGARPVVAVVVAVLFLGEAIDASHSLGIGAILVGDWLLTSYDLEGKPRQALRQKAVVFPLLAGVAFAVQDILIRLGAEHVNEPILGAAIGTATAYAFWSVGIASNADRRRALRFGRTSGWALLGGGCVGLALLSLFAALDRGEISVVIPISATQPLIVFLLSFLLLRDVEKLTTRNAAAATAIVIGSVLVIR